MKNIKLLVENNSKVNRSNYWVRDKTFHYHYVSYYEQLDAELLKDLIAHVEWLKNKHRQNIPIWIELANNKLLLKDKLVYITFEILLYYYTFYENRTVKLYWKPNSNILTNGVRESSLKYINGKINKTKFGETFTKNISDFHFRLVFREKDSKKDAFYESKIQMELDAFFKRNSIVESSKEKILQICSELIGNSLEHACSDCLIDIDITDNYTKKFKEEHERGIYKGVNIAVINFSNKLLINDLMEKLNSENLNEESYKILNNAKQIHQNFFGRNEYTEEHFYFQAVTQKGISGRKNIDQYGGTGLYVLLESLIDDADLSNCYVLSGNKILIFNEDFVSKDENGWITYNEEKDFVNYPPHKDVLSYCPIYFPGTAYNLAFVLEVKE